MHVQKYYKHIPPPPVKLSSFPFVVVCVLREKRSFSKTLPAHLSYKGIFHFTWDTSATGIKEKQEVQLKWMLDAGGVTQFFSLPTLNTTPGFSLVSPHYSQERKWGLSSCRIEVVPSSASEKGRVEEARWGLGKIEYKKGVLILSSIPLANTARKKYSCNNKNEKRILLLCVHQAQKWNKEMKHRI